MDTEPDPTIRARSGTLAIPFMDFDEKPDKPYKYKEKLLNMKSPGLRNRVELTRIRIRQNRSKIRPLKIKPDPELANGYDPLSSSFFSLSKFPCFGQ